MWKTAAFLRVFAFIRWRARTYRRSFGETKTFFFSCYIEGEIMMFLQIIETSEEGRILLMDTTNCSDLFATDRILIRTPVGTCNSSLVFFYVFYVVVLVLRYTAAFLRWKRHLNRKRHRLLTSPLSPILSFMTANMQAIFFFLIFQNTANVNNGISFSLFSLTFLPFASQYFLELYRLVRLGTRIGAMNDPELKNSSVEVFDQFGTFLVFVAGLSVIVASVALIFLSPIFPEHDILLGTIGFASKGLFLALITVGIIWQMKRCAKVIEVKMPDSLKKTQALKKIRYGEISYASFGFLTAIFFFLLASQIFPWYWYIVMIFTGGFETLGSIILECRRTALRPHTSSTNQNHDSLASPSKVKSNSSQKSDRNLSLGLKPRKFNRKRFRLNLSRVTEVSESQSKLEATVQENAEISLVPTIQESEEFN